MAMHAETECLVPIYIFLHNPNPKSKSKTRYMCYCIVNENPCFPLILIISE